jgi:hypothetical protein
MNMNETDCFVPRSDAPSLLERAGGEAVFARAKPEAILIFNFQLNFPRSAAIALPSKNIAEFQIRQTGRAAIQLPLNAVRTRHCEEERRSNPANKAIFN